MTYGGRSVVHRVVLASFSKFGIWKKLVSSQSSSGVRADLVVQVLGPTTKRRRMCTARPVW